MASYPKTDNSGNGKEDTKTEEADVRCSISLLCTYVLADSLLLYYTNPVVTYSGSYLSSRQRFGVHDGGTVISVDWFGAGRTLGGERWDFDLL